MSYLIYQTAKLKEFMAASGMAGIIIMTGFLLMAVRPKRGMKQYGWQALFFSMSIRDIWYMAVIILQFLFAFSSVAAQVSIDRIHVVLAVVLCILRIILKPGIAGILTDMGSAALILIMLLADNLLAGFLKQSVRDWGIRGMHMLLCIFIVEFALYYFFRGLWQLLKAKGRGRDGVRLGIRWRAGRPGRRADV